jgi:hypothetical protein
MVVDVFAARKHVRKRVVSTNTRRRGQLLGLGAKRAAVLESQTIARGARLQRGLSARIIT